MKRIGLLLAVVLAVALLVTTVSSQPRRNASLYPIQKSGSSVGVVTVAGVESAPLGAELTDNTGWTSADWTGDYDTGFIHTEGETTALSRTMSSTGTNLYQIVFTVTSATSHYGVTVSIGNSVAFSIYTGSDKVKTYTAGIKSVSNGDLVFTPESDFDGTITAISVKQITGTFSSPMYVKDSTATNSLEVRPTLASLENYFFGVNSGQYNTTGYGNYSLGYDALAANTSGFWNVAIGIDTLRANTTGSRNIAIGDHVLLANISGMRNTSIGNYSMPRNTTGENNAGIGSDHMFYNTTGSDNTAIGKATLYTNVSGDNNTAVGRSALSVNLGDNNTGVGSLAGANNSTGNASVYLGAYAGYYETASNKLFIDNAQRASEADGRVKSLAYGLFAATTAAQTLTFNAGTVTLGSTDNENLIIDSFTTANTIALSSGSGVTSLTSTGFRLQMTNTLSAPDDLGDYDNYQFTIQGGSATGVPAGLLFSTAADTYGGSAIVHYDTGAAGIGDLVFYTKQTAAAVPPVEVMRLTDDGNVGIGTATPNGPLEVKGTKPGVVGGWQSGMFQVTAAETAQFSNSVITGHSAYNTNTQLWYLGNTSGDNNNIGFINRQNADIQFLTNNTLRMVIDAAGDAGIAGTLARKFTVTIDNTDGVDTYLAAQLAGGLIRRGVGNEITGSVVDVTDTAANIVAAIPGCVVGSGFEFSVSNEDATDTIQVDGGTGVTIAPSDPSTAIPALSTGRFLLVVTNATGSSEAVTVHALGFTTH